MSTTASWAVAAQAFESSVASLHLWREQTVACLADFRRWAIITRLIDEPVAQRLAHVERRLEQEKLTIAFLGDTDGGTSEIINALFFADLPSGLLPATARDANRCPIEIAWDPARPAGIDLLPIETRASPKALRELLMERSEWVHVDLDPSSAEHLTAGCDTLGEMVEVSAADATAYGFDAGGAPQARVPRWRYATINLQDPLLARGIVILDAGDRRTLAAEPELSFNRLPDAAAIVFVVSAETGVGPADRDLWLEHVAPVSGIGQTGLIALDRIDALRAAAPSESEALADIDRHVRLVAGALGVAPTRVHPVSARQALAAKTRGDRDALIRSRMYRLEQTLARGMVHQRRLDHIATVRAEARGVFGETGALLKSRLAFMNDQIAELAALQSKNQKLVETLARKAVIERARLEQARAALSGVRSAHNRLGDELARLLDPAQARESAMRAREAVAGIGFSKPVGEAIGMYFQQARERIAAAVTLIEEAKLLMNTMTRKFSQEYRILAEQPPDFTTARFMAELDRLQEQSAREFKGGSSLLLRSRKTLGVLFHDSVAANVVHVFEIADRETRAWMSGFIRPLEAQIATTQEQSDARIEGMGRIQNAEGDLITRLDELRRLVADLDEQRLGMQAREARLMALLEAEREPSLA